MTAEGSSALVKRSLARKALLVIGLVVMMFLMLWARAFYGSMETYKRGEAFLRQGNHIRAITYFDRSLHWYTPLNPYVRKSAERLWEIGNKAEETGDTKLALIAYRSIRSGFYAASHFITPYKDWIERAEAKIEDLASTDREQKGVPKDVLDLADRIREDQRADSPDVFWTVILEIGLLGWIGTIIAFILVPLKREGASGFFRVSTLKWFSVAGVFFAMWIIGMMRA
ncbi:MAG: hypothetical protein JRH06_13860 [Deltaproteobacteria bacterium]|nr:hypothetical protein [Deltaproteobacteria bacterium]MBW2138625.1 hypothetical protein [Deltaproteobacteria bacterium]